MSFMHKLNLQFFAEDTGAGEGAGTTEGGDQTSNSAAGGEQKQAAQQPSADEIRASVLKELGVDSLDSAKNSLKAFKDYQDSQKSDTEKLQSQLSDYQKQMETFKQESLLKDAKIAALGKGVRSDAVDDVIKLVNGVDDVNKALDEVLKKYPSFSQAPAQGKPTFGQPDYKQKAPATEKDNWIKAFNINAENMVKRNTPRSAR